MMDPKIIFRMIHDACPFIGLPFWDHSVGLFHQFRGRKQPTYIGVRTSSY